MTEKQGDWQQKFGVIKDRSGHILESGIWADSKFLVGSVYQKYFSAHKLLLAMASPVFEAMFYGPIAEEDIIHIPDIAPDSFEAMLGYIYTDKIKITNFEEASALYYCGNKYMLRYLTEGCVKYLCGTLNPANVCLTYEFAKMFDEHELMDQCLQMIQSQTSEVLNNEGFTEAKLSTLNDIFSLTPLNVDNELELFKAAERYAKTNEDHLCKELKQLTNASVDGSQETNKNEENEANDVAMNITNGENAIFRSLLDKILLLTLTPQQFAEGAAISPFIKQTEAFAILMNIASNNTHIPIPKGFNELRKPRYKLIADPGYNQDLGVDTTKTRSQTIFRFTIPGFQKAKYMSLPFVVRNLSWRLAINPNPEKSVDQDCLGVFLYCDYMNKALAWSCFAQAEINVISNKSNAVHLIKKVEHIFSSGDKNRGSIIPMEKILDPKNGYVKNDTITIELNLAASEPSGI